MKTLVRQKVEEVLKELGLTPATQPKCGQTKSGPKVLFIFDSGLFRLDLALDEVARIAAVAGKASYFCGPRARSLMGSVDMKERTGIGCTLNHCAGDGIMKVLLKADAVIAPTMSLKVGKRIAGLTADCQVSELLMSAVLAGKKVIAASDGFKAEGVKLAIGLNTEIGHTLSALGTYGITLCETGRLADTYLKTLPGGEKTAGKPVETKTETALKLVTAAEINKAVNEKRTRILVAQKGIVTPLANDLSREYKVLIVRENS